MPPGTATGHPGSPSTRRRGSRRFLRRRRTAARSGARAAARWCSATRCRTPGVAAVGTQSETEAEVAVRRGLRCLRKRRDEQRMPRVDRHHEGSYAQPGHGRADETCERQRVVVEPLGQPYLSDPDLMGAARLVDEIVDDIRTVRAFGKHDPSRHTATNWWAREGYSRRRPSTRLDSKACDVYRFRGRSRSYIGGSLEV